MPFNLEFRILRHEKLTKIGITKGTHKLNNINLHINSGLGNVCVSLKAFFTAGNIHTTSAIKLIFAIKIRSQKAFRLLILFIPLTIIKRKSFAGRGIRVCQYYSVVFGEKLFHRDVKFIIQGNQPVVYGKHRGINLIKL